MQRKHIDKERVHPKEAKREANIDQERPTSYVLLPTLPRALYRFSVHIDAVFSLSLSLSLLPVRGRGNASQLSKTASQLFRDRPATSRLAGY